MCTGSMRLPNDLDKLGRLDSSVNAYSNGRSGHTLSGPFEHVGQQASCFRLLQISMCATMQSLQLLDDQKWLIVVDQIVTCNWCMHLGRSIGDSISLKQMGQSPVSSDASFERASSANVL